MTEIASNVERIHPEGVSRDTYIFATDTVPPRFARVDFGTGSYFWADGPLTKEQLDISLTGGDDERLTEDQQRVCNDSSPLGYAVELGDIGCKGIYPGGRDRIALNVARFVLGA